MVRGQDNARNSRDTEQVRNIIGVHGSWVAGEQQTALDQIQVAIEAEHVIVNVRGLVTQMSAHRGVHAVAKVMVRIVSGPVVAVRIVQRLIVQVVTVELIGDRGSSGRVRIDSPEGLRHDHVAIGVQNVASRGVQHLFADHEETLIAGETGQERHVHEVAAVHDVTRMTRDDTGLSGVWRINAGSEGHRGESTRNGQIQPAGCVDNQISGIGISQLIHQILCAGEGDSQVSGQVVGDGSGIRLEGPRREDGATLRDDLVEQTVGQGRQHQVWEGSERVIHPDYF